MIFKYIASLEEGGKERGVINAPNLASAQKLLKERRKVVIKLEEVRSSVNDAPAFKLKNRTAAEKKLASIFITSAQIEVALGQLSTMLEGGVPILAALQTIAAQSGYFLSRALFVVANKLQNGTSFAVALKSEMAFLGNVIIGMISAGEANGDISRMCMYSAELIARRRKLKGQVIQALTYPALVVLVTVGIVTFLMISVIPKIMKFLNNRSASLPPITQALVDSTDFIQKNGIYFIIIPILIAITISLLRRNNHTAISVDRAVLHLPIIGKIFRDSSNMLWCRTLGILLHSGINIMQAMDYTIASLSNHFYQNELEDMKKNVAQGHPLSTALRVSNLHVFIPLADSMLVVGENTGNVDTALLKVAEFCDNDLQKRISTLSKMIEPALFIVIGGLVGFVYIAFFMGMMTASTGK